MTAMYDVTKLNRKHDEVSRWLGPMWRAMAVCCRFEDGVEGQPAVVDDTAVTPAAAPAAPAASDSTASLLDVAGITKPDGSFIDGWYDSELLPEDIRGSESLKVIKSLPDLVKRTVHAEKMVGKNKVPLPKPDATEEEWGTFWDTVGQANPELVRPKTPDEYKFDVPEDMADLFPDDRLKDVREFAHSIGVTKKQFEAYLNREVETARQILAEDAATQQRIHDENILALKKEWGEAYPERQHIVKRLIAETFGTDESGRLAFLQKFAADPDFVRFAANVGAKMVEHKSIVAELTQQTPNEALGRIKELENTPGYLDMGSNMTPEQRSEITAKIHEQYKIAYPGRK